MSKYLKTMGSRAMAGEPLERRLLLAAKWTVMVYLDGDNDLEPAAIGDFAEMAAVGSDANVNIVVEFDRASGYDSTNGNWTDTRRGLVTPGALPSTSWGSSIGEVNMGDPATLSSFIDWGVSTYPAQQYAIVIWDHGGGLKGIAWDNSSPGDYLELREIGSALGAVTTNMDLIGFDACQMGMTEIAYQLQSEGSVFVGSEADEPNDGWPYDTALADLKAAPTMTAEQFGAKIVDRYGQSYAGEETMSASRLGSIGAMGSALSNFATTAMTYAAATDYGRMSSYRDQASYFTDPDYRDLGQFLTSVAGDSLITPAIRSAAQTALDAYNAALVRNHSSATYAATGLAIYFQPSLTPLSSDYNSTMVAFAAGTQWDEFLAWWENGAGADLLPTSFALASQTMVGLSSASVTFTLENQGPTGAGAFDVEFFWSATSDFADGDEIAAPLVVTDPYYQPANTNAVHFMSLAAGYAATRVVTLAIPPSAPLGSSASCFLGIRVDESNTVEEYNETNNYGRGGGISEAQAYWMMELYRADMNSNPGWTLQGGWAYGTPMGSDGDPISGATGSNVVGYNLNGAYANNISTTYWATTGAINTAGYTNITLSFMRWLGIEENLYDSASIAASTNGVSWTTIWSNGSTSAIDDGEWTPLSYTLPSTFNNQPAIYLRWGLGPTDFAFAYCGWNIDDVVVRGQAGNSATPGTPDLLAVSDVGWSSTDNLTNLDNSSTSKRLLFRVSNTISGATVRIYRDGVAIGSAVASGTTADVLSDGVSDIPDGPHQITARQTQPGMNESGASSSLSITVDTAPPTQQLFFVADGAIQRSMVTSLQVFFSEQVNLSSALSLRRANGSDISNVTMNISNPSGDKRTYLAGFSGTGVVSGSLPDGLYVLGVSAAGVMDQAGNLMTSSRSNRFHRLFGDADGDRDVDKGDLLKFRLAFNKSASYWTYWYFDYNNDTLINSSDYAQFKQRLVNRILL